MRASTRRRARLVGGFLVYFGALWLLWDTVLVYPIKLFVVFLHEVSHALVAVATGGRIEQIVVTPDQGGLCRCPGGNAFLTLSAGYLGSLGWGALFVLGARRRSGTRWIVAALGAAMAALTLRFVRDAFGVVFGLGFGVALVLAARYLSEGVNRALLTLLGLTSCLYAVLDIQSDVLSRPGLPSDAVLLGRLTGVPSIVWGVLWIGVALAVCYWLLKRTVWEG